MLLTRALSEAVEQGADIGSARVLASYATAAAVSNGPMEAAVHALWRLFDARDPAVRVARGMGLASVNACGPARRAIARYAMGGA